MPKDQRYRKRGQASAAIHSGAHFQGQKKLQELKLMSGASPEDFDRILNLIGDESHPQPDQRCPQRQALSQGWAKSGSGDAMLDKLLLSMHEALG